MDEANLSVVGDPHAESLHRPAELSATRLVADERGEASAVCLELDQAAIQFSKAARLHDSVASPPDYRRSDDHEPDE